MSLLVSLCSVLAVMAELVGFVIVGDDDEPAGHSDSLPALCVSPKLLQPAVMSIT